MPTKFELSVHERSDLLDFLIESFNLEELKTLAFDLSLDYELFPHDTKPKFCRELLRYFERRKQLNFFLTQVLRFVPNTDLSELLSRMPPCEPRVKVQIILYLEELTRKARQEFIEAVSRLFNVSRDEVMLLGAAHGSIKLLFGLPASAGQRLANSGLTTFANHRVKAISAFNTLELAEQHQWRNLILHQDLILSLARPKGLVISRGQLTTLLVMWTVVTALIAGLVGSLVVAANCSPPKPGGILSIEPGVLAVVSVTPDNATIAPVTTTPSSITTPPPTTAAVTTPPASTPPPVTTTNPTTSVPDTTAVPIITTIAVTTPPVITTNSVTTPPPPKQAIINITNPTGLITVYDGQSKAGKYPGYNTIPAGLEPLVAVNYYDVKGTEVPNPVNAGIYTIVFRSKSPDYTVNDPKLTLTINKAVIGVILDRTSLSQTSGKTSPVKISSTNPPVKENVIVLSYTGINGTSYPRSQNVPTNPGNYQIDVSVLDITVEAQNYNAMLIDPAPAILTIIK